MNAERKITVNGILRSALLLGAFVLALNPKVMMAQSSAADDWGRALAAAKQEGKVELYFSFVPPLMTRLKADFEKAYPGITVDGTRIAGMALPIRVEQEKKSGSDGADMAILSEVLWAEDRARAGDILAPNGPAANGWPKEYLRLGVLPVLGIEPILIAYNTRLVKTNIASYEDLLRPEFRGQIAITEPQSTTAVAWFDWLEKTYGADFLARLAAQRPRSYTGAVPATQAAISGENAVAAYSVATVAMPLISQGAPLKMVVTKPSFGLLYMGALLKHAKRPNAARVFMDYLMSERGQTVWHGVGGTASALPRIPGSLDAGAIVPYDAKPYTAEFVKARTERINSIFGKN